MTQSDLELLKSNIGNLVEIETDRGECLLVKPISVFDQEDDPDMFFWDVTSNPMKPDSEQTEGYSLPLKEIIAVRVATGSR
jgi:hypothetical protein